MEALIAAGITGLAQAWVSEKARGATQDELNKLKDAFNAIKPPNYDLTIQDPPALHQEQLALPQFNGQNVKFDTSKLTAEQKATLGQYVPTIAPYVAEQKSTTIQNTSDMQLGKDAQRQALQKLMAVGAGQYDPQYQAAVVKAQQAAQQEAQSRQQSILQDFSRRGQGGSGLNLAAQLGGASQSMGQLGMQNLAAASQGYQNRLNALAQGASIGGQISAEDQNMQLQNANIINGFNQRMAANQNAYNQTSSDAINQANRYNLGRNDTNAQWTYNAQVAQNANDDARAKYLYGLNQADQKYQNQMKEAQYANQMGQYSGQANLGAAQSALYQQGAADTNQFIGGLGAGVGTYYSGQAAADAAQKSENAQNAREVYKKTGQWPGEGY